MSVIYVREQGAVVRRRGERLLVTQGEATLLDIPLLHVEQVVVFGNVQLTTPAVARLLQAEIDVVYLSQYGKFRGRLIHTGSKFARLRVAQLRKMSDEAVNLTIAKQVVVGKLSNQRALLHHYLGVVAKQDATAKDRRDRILRSSAGIGRLIQKATTATQADSLRGFEGSAGAHYWAAFRVLLTNDFGFQGRKYFPPPDPVNALLSFGYSLLLKDVSAAVQLVGLDPFLGFFHTIDYGRPSLSLDLMEEFRPVLVDKMVLKLVNEAQITANHFEQTANDKQPLRLTEPAIQQVIAAYETALNQSVPHLDAGGQTAQRRVIELQVRRLARVIQDQALQYEPFLMEQRVRSKR